MPIVVPIGVRRTIENPMDQEMRDMLFSRRSYVVNVSDTQWLVQRTHGVYIVKPAEEGQIIFTALGKNGADTIREDCAPGQEYTIMMVTPRLELLDHGDEKFTEMVNKEKAIADDIAGHCNDSILSIEGHTSFSGVFVSAKNPPSAEDLSSARRRLRAFYRDQVSLGDQFYEDPKTHREITNLMRRAAKLLNLKKPWTYQVESEESCGACGKNVPVGVAICGNCGAILDEEKARRFFPERFQVAPLPVPDSETGEITEKPAPRPRRKGTTRT